MKHFLFLLSFLAASAYATQDMFPIKEISEEDLTKIESIISEDIGELWFFIEIKDHESRKPPVLPAPGDKAATLQELEDMVKLTSQRNNYATKVIVCANTRFPKAGCRSAITYNFDRAEDEWKIIAKEE